jgi:hypothetical protein
LGHAPEATYLQKLNNPRRTATLLSFFTTVMQNLNSPRPEEGVVEFVQVARSEHRGNPAHALEALPNAVPRHAAGGAVLHAAS